LYSVALMAVLLKYSTGNYQLIWRCSVCYQPFCRVDNYYNRRGE